MVVMNAEEKSLNYVVDLNEQETTSSKTNMNEGYSLCLNKWAIDKEIKNELGLLLILSSLCAKDGFCFASNEYLASIFGVTNVSISNKIKKLEDKGYIEVNYQKRGCEVISREIRLKNFLTDDYKNFYSSSYLININNKEKEIYKEKENHEERVSSTTNSKSIREKEFEVLWRVYPKKVGKKKSLDIYLRTTKNELATYEQVYTGLLKYIQYIKVNNIEHKYIKDGSTWFNGRCWEDEYEVEEMKSSIKKVREGEFDIV